ncbi:ADP-ribosyl cyclase/cyclic ADP-ribose hydrolase 2 isoform X2 [Dendropsophus ebraccatus]|uniref:ADP-ribosyl cyclase/cyclic ADP-ribose hydrolase 2 isoform X2 n=1 Tax=Dendropsophus ebraccatus TaxID=150705 RepID=UPI00383171A9
MFWPSLSMQLPNLTRQSLLFYIIFIMQLEGTSQWTGPGTTPNLETIVIGRCNDYIETVNPSVGKKNCSAIWEAFKSAFVSKDPCAVLPSDYERYINLTLHDLPIDKSLFWENNKQLVHRLSDRGKRYMPLGDTLMGWLGDNVNFCGSRNNSGFDYTSCPITSECEHNPEESFWRLASITYAQHSHGEIQIMLNGSTPGGAFPEPRDSCGENSIATLQSVLSRRGFPYKCYDNYRQVRILQCVDFPGNPACSTNSGIGRTLSWMTMIPVLFVTIMNYGNKH